MIEVCVEEDGFRECGYVSSMHLVAPKCVQLRKAILDSAEAAMFKNVTGCCPL